MRRIIEVDASSCNGLPNCGAAREREILRTASPLHFAIGVCHPASKAAYLVHEILEEPCEGLRERLSGIRDRHDADLRVFMAGSGDFPTLDERAIRVYDCFGKACSGWVPQAEREDATLEIDAEQGRFVLRRFLKGKQREFYVAIGRR